MNDDTEAHWQSRMESTLFVIQTLLPPMVLPHATALPALLFLQCPHLLVGVNKEAIAIKSWWTEQPPES